MQKPQESPVSVEAGASPPANVYFLPTARLVERRDPVGEPDSLRDYARSLQSIKVWLGLHRRGLVD